MGRRHVLRIGAACLALACGAVSPVTAQIIGSGPAELPPDGFNGRQYVDSAGCVFVKAGRGDTVTWVPRVTRNREPLCGYTPTRFAQKASLPAPASTAVSVSGASPRAVRVRSQGLGRRAPVRQSSGKLQVAPAVTVAPQIVTAPSVFGSCGTRPFSARYLSGCGSLPEGATAVRAASPAPGVGIVVIPPQTRNSTHGNERATGSRSQSADLVAVIVPEGGLSEGASSGASRRYSFTPNTKAATVIAGPAESVARLRRATERMVVPSGYKEAWEDGRLNVFRGVMSEVGDAQMSRTWTNQVPIRLRKTRP